MLYQSKQKIMKERQLACLFRITKTKQGKVIKYRHLDSIWPHSCIEQQ